MKKGKSFPDVTGGGSLRSVSDSQDAVFFVVTILFVCGTQGVSLSLLTSAT